MDGGSTRCRRRNKRGAHPTAHGPQQVWPAELPGRIQCQSLSWVTSLKTLLRHENWMLITAAGCRAYVRQRAASQTLFLSLYPTLFASEHHAVFLVPYWAVDLLCRCPCLQVTSSRGKGHSVSFLSDTQRPAFTQLWSISSNDPHCLRCTEGKQALKGPWQWQATALVTIRATVRTSLGLLRSLLSSCGTPTALSLERIPSHTKSQ